MQKFSMQRMGVAAATGVVTLAAFVAQAQAADAPATAAVEELEEVIVTGTAIRGAAPVGVNLITVGREQIEESGGQTLQQILKSVPAITGFGNAAQGGFGSADGAGTFAPTIHGLGASASNGTLILIDGHRLPLSGINHTLADPNVIAPLAIERVEVLPEGASSTYGSDAVAGVINFITRRNYNGFEASLQGSTASNYNTYSMGFLWGNTWDKGSVLFSYNLQNQGNLLRGDRGFTMPDHSAQGGGNFRDANCSPATIQAGASVYQSPYTTVANPNPTAANQGNCTFLGATDLLPKNERHNVLAKLTRQINDNLEFATDIVYSQQRTISNVARGSVSNVTVFGPGNAATTQINPYYTNPTGFTGNTQTIRGWSADELFGPGAKGNATAQSCFVTSSLTYKFGKNWQAALGVTAGVDDSSLKTVGALCGSCALLALNGTALGSGSTTASPVPGSPPVINSQLASGAIALDVWNPASTNRTNAATRAYLLDSTVLQSAHQALKDYTLKLDGSLATLPGGDLRLAVGAEYLSYMMNEEQQSAKGTGPVSSNSRALSLRLGRNVKSVYAEFLIPIIGQGNSMTGIKKLELDLSARTDKYNDFGNTTNPKFAFTWGVTDGLTFRGNVGKSFTAPALTSRGNELGITAESGFSGAGANGGAGIPGNFQIPITFPGASGLPPGTCNTTTGLCTIATSTITGLTITGGNKDLRPETGKTYSFGFDWASQAIRGLRVSATYWSAKYEDAITAPQAAFAIAAPGLNNILTIYPTGATQAQIDALTQGLPQNGALLGPVYWAYSFQQRNAFSLDATGVDFDIAYAWSTGVGDFNVDLNASRKLKMDQKFGSDGGSFSVLNSVGVNTTFPSNKMAGRLTGGWKRGNWNADVYMNYTGSYVNWSGTAAQGNTAWNITRAVSATGAALWPTGGGQPVESWTTFDFHLGYDFEGEGALKGVKVFVDGSNIFDKQPPFFNTSVGYDNFNANPIGRLFTAGISKKW